MIDKKIIGIILNNPELYCEFSKYPDLITDYDCKKLEEIIKTVTEKNTLNKDIVENYIKEKKTFDINKFWEIYDSEYDADKFKGFLNELLTRKAKRMLRTYDVNTQKSDKNHIDIKQDLYELADGIEDANENDIEDSKNICRELLEDEQNKEPDKYIPSCIRFFDSYQLGYETSDFILYAGQESIGKTSKILDLIIKQLEKKIKVGFFSCEELRKNIYKFLACRKAKINYLDLRNKTLSNIDRQKYIDAIAWLYEQGLYIVDDVHEWNDIKKQTKIMKNNHDVDMFYIDHMHHVVSNEYKDEYSLLKHLCLEIKSNCKKLAVPHFVIGILNGDGKKADDPQLWHVKGNRDIEYYVDIGIVGKCINYAIDGNYNYRLVKYFIRKNRHGRLGSFIEKFDVRTRDFKEHFNEC